MFFSVHYTPICLESMEFHLNGCGWSDTDVCFSVFIIRRESAPGKGHGICIFVTAVEIAAGPFMDVVVSERRGYIRRMRRAASCGYTPSPIILKQGMEF